MAFPKYSSGDLRVWPIKACETKNRKSASLLILSIRDKWLELKNNHKGLLSKKNRSKPQNKAIWRVKAPKCLIIYLFLYLIELLKEFQQNRKYLKSRLV